MSAAELRSACPGQRPGPTHSKTFTFKSLEGGGQECPPHILLSQAEEFFAEEGVLLGQAKVSHFVGAGLGADDLGCVLLFLP